MPKVFRLLSNSHLIGALSSLVILIALLLLRPLFPVSPPLLLFCLAVIPAVWQGNWLAAISTTAWSIFLSIYFLYPPYETLCVPVSSEIVRLLLLAMVALATGLSIAALRRRELRAIVEMHRHRDSLQELVDKISKNLELKSTELLSRAEELARTQVAFEDMSARFRGIVTCMADAVITIDKDQTILLFNPAAEELFGITRDQVAGGKLDRFIPQRHRAAHAEYFNHFAQTSESRRKMAESTEVMALRANGEEFPVEASISSTPPGPNQLFTVVLRDISERRWAEALAHRQMALQDQLAKVAASVPGVIYSFLQDVHGRYSMPYCSAAFETVFGLAGSSVHQNFEPVFARIVREDVRDVLRNILHSAKTLTIWHGCFRYNHPAKGKIWLEGHSIPHRQKDGSTLWHGYVQDVTEGMQTMELMKLSEVRFRRLIEATGAMVWTTDAKGIPNADSISWRQFTGFPLTRLFDDWQWLEAIHPDDRERAKLKWRQSLDTATTFEIETRLRHHSGDYRHTFCRALPLLNADGSVREWVGMTSDISARVEAQRQLRDSELRFRGIFNSTYEFLGLVDLQGILLEANRPALEFIVADAQDVIGKPFEDAPWWRELSEERAKLHQAIHDATRGKTARFETRHKGKDGALEIIDFFIHPIFDDSGQVRFLVPEGRRITELKTIQQQLLEQAEQLRDAARNKDEFIAMLSHEIRNPLAAVSNAAAVLQRLKTEDANLHRAASIITEQTQQLNRLVADLLDVSRMSHGKFALAKTCTCANELIIRAINMSQPFVSDLQRRLHVDLPEDSFYIDADPARIVQVIDNLLHNAAKYASAGGNIWLSAYRRNDSLIIQVRDDGEGIPDDLLPHIFEPFRQGRNVGSQAAPGLGLGLNLSRRLVELHGGQLTVTSDGTNPGATFKVCLPLRAPPAPELTYKNPQGAAETAAVKLKILVIDDETAVAESLAMLLNVMGYQTRILTDPQLAVSSVSEFQPDVVLLDLGLPGTSGYEVLRQIQRQEQNAHLPVIALSGYGQPQDLAKSAAAGFTKHLIKPIQPEELEAAILSLSRAS